MITYMHRRRQRAISIDHDGLEERAIRFTFDMTSVQMSQESR
jgi:hypothetical protein